MSLEEIDPEVCARKVKALRTLVLTEEELKCRNCDKQKEVYCQNYVPFSKFKQPIRRGVNAYVLSAY